MHPHSTSTNSFHRMPPFDSSPALPPHWRKTYPERCRRSNAGTRQSAFHSPLSNIHYLVRTRRQASKSSCKLRRRPRSARSLVSRQPTHRRHQQRYRRSNAGSLPISFHPLSSSSRCSEPTSRRCSSYRSMTRSSSPTGSRRGRCCGRCTPYPRRSGRRCWSAGTDNAACASCCSHSPKPMRPRRPGSPLRRSSPHTAAKPAKLASEKCLDRCTPYPRRPCHRCSTGGTAPIASERHSCRN